MLLYDRSVQADFAVELGREDETLEMPWEGDRDGPKYCDLKRHPELLTELEEVDRAAELGEFLLALNSPASRFETAKCDLWSTTDMRPEEDIFHATRKFASYVDILFSDKDQAMSLADHEQFARAVTEPLSKAPKIRAAAEFLIRRCHYHVKNQLRNGFYITFYLFGYGEDEPSARANWAIALKLVQNALRQASLAGSCRR